MQCQCKGIHDMPPMNGQASGLCPICHQFKLVERPRDRPDQPAQPMLFSTPLKSGSIDPMDDSQSPGIMADSPDAAQLPSFAAGGGIPCGLAAMVDESDEDEEDEELN
jgi:hypothetical protein